VLLQKKVSLQSGSSRTHLKGTRADFFLYVAAQQARIIEKRAVIHDQSGEFHSLIHQKVQPGKIFTIS
jgi:hypothetical protein